MYAIVEIAGHQYKVRKDQRLYVNRLEGKEGSSLTFDKVLLTDNDGKVEVGAPVISGIKVDANIIEHLKADKVKVFKKKRRKGYQKLNGHRQYISLIEITGIGSGTAKSTAKKAEPKAEEKAEAKPEVKQTAAKPEAKKTASKAKPEEKKSTAEAKPKKTASKTEAKPKVKKTAAKAEAKETAPKKKAATKKEDDKS